MSDIAGAASGALLTAWIEAGIATIDGVGGAMITIAGGGVVGGLTLEGSAAMGNVFTEVTDVMFVKP